MSDETSDPLGLGLNLGDVNTSRPCLPEGIHALNIKSVEVKANKAETGRNLVVVFETVNESVDSTGEKTISPGFPITRYYALQQSDNEKAPDYRADLARLQDAVEGTKQGERPPFNPYNYVGKLVLARIKIKHSDEYGDGNEIARLEQMTA